MTGQSFVLLPGPRRERIIESLIAFLRSLAPDVVFRVTIGREAKERTDPQNRYLWGVCYATLAKATGHRPEDWHEYFCGEFFGWRERQLPGDRVERIPRRSTTRDEDGRRAVMSAADFAEFVEMILATAAQNGLFIPDPDSVPDDPARWGQ